MNYEVPMLDYYVELYESNRDNDNDRQRVLTSWAIHNLRICNLSFQTKWIPLLMLLHHSWLSCFTCCCLLIVILPSPQWVWVKFSQLIRPVWWLKVRLRETVKHKRRTLLWAIRTCYLGSTMYYSPCRDTLPLLHVILFCTNYSTEVLTDSTAHNRQLSTLTAIIYHWVLYSMVCLSVS
jgi:hypothetical protein